MIGSAASILYHFFTQKDTALYIAMLNCSEIGMDDKAAQFQQSYAKYAGIDLGKYELNFNTNYFIGDGEEGSGVAIVYNELEMVVTEKLMASIAAGELDIMMGGGSLFGQYAYGLSFQDVRAFLSAEQIAKYEPDFYYIDMAAARQLHELSAQLEDTSVVELPDPRKPELMEEPIPVAIYVDNDKISDYYYFRNISNGLALGMVANSSQTENVLAFIDYLESL